VDLTPLPVKGYQPQSKTNVQIVNANKDLEEQSLRVLDELARLDAVDKRWLAIGRTHLEQAWMAINRSVFQPKRIALPTDTKE
jgi:hypothetical protein